LSGVAVPMHGIQGYGFWTHWDPFSFCQDDSNLIVTCFNAVFKIILRKVTT